MTEFEPEEELREEKSEEKKPVFVGTLETDGLLFISKKTLVLYLNIYTTMS